MTLPDHLENIYTIVRPQKNALPLVFDSPHSGRIYPADFAPVCPQTLLTGAEDNHVDSLFEKAPQHGAGLLCALFPRTYIDTNRAVSDIDAALLAAAWPHDFAPTSRSHAGIGLIRRLLRPGVPLYNRELSVAEVRARIEQYYQPYHAALDALLDEAHYNFGQAWHVNAHAMPSVNGGVTAHAGRQVDFVVGDRDGTSCDLAFTHAIRDALKDLGYRVAINNPYKGVELVRRHGRPAHGRHSLQLEINKALYWDEQRHKKSAGFAALQNDLDNLMATIAQFVGSRLVSLAAD